jgi:catechol 2,3-dioxygenase-like lactoylglutathione lyase family enzyme
MARTMDAHFGYMAIVSDQPERLADFYARHFQMWELGRSDAGDVSITDGFLNVSLLKRRPGVEGASGRPGLSHFGIAVSDIREVEANLEEHLPSAELQAEPGDLHHGEYRVVGPNGLPVSISTTNFGVQGQARRLPRIRHMALCMDPPNDPQVDFLVNVFGFREVSTSLVRRRDNVPVRFVGDGNVNLALLVNGGAGFYKAGMERPHEDVFKNDAERAINTKSGLQHFGFVVADAQAVMDAQPAALAQWNNKREARDMAEYRVFDPDLNAIDLSQRSGFEVDFDKWENARGSGLSTEERLAV